jgi:tetratricopeptide (TPR) repeat protein
VRSGKESRREIPASSSFCRSWDWWTTGELAAIGVTTVSLSARTIPTAIEASKGRTSPAAYRNDHASAEHAFAEAVRQAPLIPRAYKDWGDLLVLQGDATGAIVKYMEANKRGSRWADPLKAWGDVLVKQGKTKEALAKYDEALKYAPNWKQLQDARETLAKQKT